MRYLLTILCFIALQASGQALFHAHNRQSAPAGLSSPLDLGSVAGWWKADYGVSGTSTVTAWLDVTGAHTLTAAAGKEPSLSGGVANGHPALYFNGSARLAGSTLTLSQPFTMVVVGQVNPTDADAAVLIDSYNPVQSVIYRGGGGDLDGKFAYNAGGGVVVSATTADNDFNMLLAVGNGASSLFFSNNYTAGTINPGTNGLSGISLGDIRGNPSPLVGGYSLDGYIAEVVIYSRALTVEEALQLYQYFKNKYNLTDH